MQTYLRQIYDAFGPHRMFWGTDITKMPCSWRQCVTMFTEELPWLGEQDKRLVMGDALCAWWGWDRAGWPNRLPPGAPGRRSRGRSAERLNAAAGPGARGLGAGQYP